MIDAMLGGELSLAPSPTASPLHGFIARVAPGARYAIYPAGRYSRACIDDFDPRLLNHDGRRFLGLIDDSCREFSDLPVAPLAAAARDWRLDAILILRDTPEGALQRRVLELQTGEGALRHVEIITQPLPTLPAMLAHLGTYHPACDYEPAFLRTCRAADAPLDAGESTLLVTLDAEAFPAADRDALGLYSRIVREMAGVFADAGCGFTFCVQLSDSCGGMVATPTAAVEAVIEILGRDAIGLHGIDHSMPVEGYTAGWFEQGLAGLQSRFGVRPTYWAPPGWTVNWRTLARLSQAGIRTARGIWTGPNCRRNDTVTTQRFPTRLGSLTLVPYAYVDWMFTDLAGTRFCDDAVMRSHEALAAYAAAAPCVIELVAHPYRLVGADWSRRLMIVRRTLQRYRSAGVRLAGVHALDSLCPARETTHACNA